MDKVFEADILYPAGEGNYACTTVPMPATDYELRDALEKVKIPDGGSITIEITQFNPEMKFLAEHTETEICDLSAVFRMNALAEKITRMNPAELCAFEGLVRMELQETDSISAGRLYNLAANTDCCHVIEAGNDRELGHFYVDNGFLPEYEKVPETVLEHLDYAKIGREMRENEGGVFLSGGGYVVQHEELTEAAEDFKPDDTPELKQEKNSRPCRKHREPSR